jgi:hypothetical protein
MLRPIHCDDDRSGTTGEARTILGVFELGLRAVTPRRTNRWRCHKFKVHVEMGIPSQVRMHMAIRRAR